MYKATFFVLNKYINFDITEWRKTFYLNLQENFPKVLTVFELLYIYIFFVDFGAHVSHEWIRYIQSEQPGFPVFPFQLRIIISILRAWENISRWPALNIHVATVVCLYHHHIHMALSVKFGTIVICNNKNNNYSNTTIGT